MLLAKRRRTKITMGKKMRTEAALALSCLGSILFFVVVLAFPDEALWVWERLLRMAGKQ